MLLLIVIIVDKDKDFNYLIIGLVVYIIEVNERLNVIVIKVSFVCRIIERMGENREGWREKVRERNKI